MSGPARHLSKTDLRRGLFTKSAQATVSEAAVREVGTGTDEQTLLFGEIDPVPLAKTERARKLTRAAE